MSRKIENSGFICANCGCDVKPLTNGSYRNHCPECLFSLHVDGRKPGDRSSACQGLMKPVGLVYTGKKGYQIRHRCLRCGLERVNVLAEHTVMPDNREQIYRLMTPEKGD